MNRLEYTFQRFFSYSFRNKVWNLLTYDLRYAAYPFNFATSGSRSRGIGIEWFMIYLTGNLDSTRTKELTVKIWKKAFPDNLQYLYFHTWKVENLQFLFFSFVYAQNQTFIFISIYNHFMPLASFNTLWKYHRSSGLLIDILNLVKNLYSWHQRYVPRKEIMAFWWFFFLMELLTQLNSQQLFLITTKTQVQC